MRDLCVPRGRIALALLLLKGNNLPGEMYFAAVSFSLSLSSFLSFKTENQINRLQLDQFELPKF